MLIVCGSQWLIGYAEQPLENSGVLLARGDGDGLQLSNEGDGPTEHARKSGRRDRSTC
jgi:hypothetical protein